MKTFHSEIMPFKGGIKTVILQGLIVLIFIGQSLFAQWPPPPPSDMNWFGLQSSEQGPLPNGAYLAAMGDNGNVYIAGQEGSGVKAAVWDGLKWTVLGERLARNGSPLTEVNAIAVAVNGDVYLGGNFNRAYNGNGAPPDTTPNIARWDAAAGMWTGVGQGTDLAVVALTIDDINNQLYVGGPISGFNPDGSVVTLNGIGRWNNNQNIWEAIGQGVSAQVRTLAVDGSGQLFAAGNFEHVFDPNGTQVTVNGIARWDGSQWHSLGQGLAPSPYYPGSMVFDTNGDLILGGRFDTAVNSNGSTVAGPVVRWDGSQWMSLSHAPVFNLYSLGIDSQGNIYSMYMAPNFDGPYVERWSGSQWETIADIVAEYASALAANPNVAGTKVYVGGLFFSILNPLNGQNLNLNNNAIWNGVSWRPMIGQSGANGTVLAFNSGGLNQLGQPYLFVGGNFSKVSFVNAENIARYDGFQWSSLGGGVNGTVHSISTYRGHFIVAGGEFDHATNPDGTQINALNVAIWNGADNWEPLGQGINGPVYAVLNRSGFFSGGRTGTVIVGGNFDTAYNPDGMPVPVNSLAQWNWLTEEWTSIGGGVAGGAQEIRSLAEDPNSFQLNFYAGGSFSQAINPDNSVVDCNNVIFWNGEGPDHWEALGQGVDGPVRVVAPHRKRGINYGDRRVWVGGDFQTSTNENGTFLNTPYISLWNGNTNQWNALAGGVNAPVDDIAPITTAHYEGAFIGGEFTLGYYPNGNARGLNHVGLYCLMPNGAAGGVRPAWNERYTQGIDGPVRALHSLRICFGAGELVYAGGDFNVAGVRTARSLAKWKYTWHSGMSHVVLVSRSGSSGGNGARAVAVVPGCSPLNTEADYVLFDSLGFRQSAFLDSMARFAYFDLNLYDQDDLITPLATFDSLSIPGAEPSAMILTGVDDPTQFAPNPEGSSTAIAASIEVFATQVSQPGNVEVLFVNGVTDAPTVDISEPGGGTVADSLPYGGPGKQVSLQPANYTFEVNRHSDGQLLGTYNINLSDNTDQAVLVTLSGFLDPSANQNGPAMGLQKYVAGSTAVVGITPGNEPKPVAESFRLHQNYPNPFNPETTIEFELLPYHRGRVTLKIYNTLGQLVNTLLDENLLAGRYQALWNGRNSRGNRVASGVYFYALRTERFSNFKKMILLR